MRPWLAEVLRNVIRMRARRERSRAHWERAAAEPLQTSVASPEAVRERLELQRIVVECVLALEEPLRATVLLHFFEERSSAEIARLTGVPAGTVRPRLKRASSGCASSWTRVSTASAAGGRCARASRQRHSFRRDGESGLADGKARGPRRGVPRLALALLAGGVWHDWVGANFELFLRTHDPDGDLRRMLAAVTAITMGTRSATSFYTPEAFHDPQLEVLQEATGRTLIRLTKLGPLEWFDNHFEQDRVFILSGPNVDVCRYIMVGWVANLRFENSTDADCNEPVLGLRLVQHQGAEARLPP